jgi:hypothetical protein
MKNVFSLRKRSFLSPVSTGFTSHIFAEVESSNEGEIQVGTQHAYHCRLPAQSPDRILLGD